MSAPEPESVSNLVSQMQAASQHKASNGATPDADTIVRIYFEFRWGLKKAAMIGQVGYDDIVALLEAAVKRIQKQVRDPVLMQKALVKFLDSKRKLDDWYADEKLRGDVCPKCALPRFMVVHGQIVAENGSLLLLPVLPREPKPGDECCRGLREND